MKIDKNEKQILDSYEKGEWVEIPDMENEIKKHKSYAEQTLKKSKRINIRITKRDLELIRRLAVEEGLPYQTLISSLIHKYVNGKL